MIVGSATGSPTNATSPGIYAAANNKLYDANTSATGALTVAGLFGSDSLGASAASTAFTDSNPGVGKTVNFTGITISGNVATMADYTFVGLTSGMTATANITALPAVVSVPDSGFVGTASAQTGLVQTSGIPKLFFNNLDLSAKDTNTGAEKVSVNEPAVGEQKSENKDKK
jgi:hypothetical protein